MGYMLLAAIPFAAEYAEHGMKHWWMFPLIALAMFIGHNLPEIISSIIKD